MDVVSYRNAFPHTGAIQVVLPRRNTNKSWLKNARGQEATRLLNYYTANEYILHKGH